MINITLIRCWDSVCILPFVWKKTSKLVKLLTLSNATRGQFPNKWKLINILSITSDNFYCNTEIQTSSFVLDPRLIRDDTGEDWRVAGFSTSEHPAGNTILKPAVTLLTDQRTSRITKTNAFSTCRWSGAYHPRTHILLVAATKSATFVPAYYRQHDLSHDAVVSRI